MAADYAVVVVTPAASEAIPETARPTCRMPFRP